MILDARAIRAEMIRQRVGCKDLAGRVRGLSTATISRLSRSNTNAQMPTIARLAEALNVRPEQILVDGRAGVRA